MAANPENNSFPPAIGKAVIAVMRSLGTLAKGNENKFDHYDYASIDDFIEHVRGHCADAGLFFIPSEARDAETTEVSKKDGKPMVVWSSRFAFTLAHESGQSYGPIFKTVAVQFNGAQAAGSAQSYAMKQLMRGLFLIKTGDKDDPDEKGLDIASKGDVQTDLQKTAAKIRNNICKAKDIGELGIVWSDSELDRGLLPELAEGFLKKEYDRKKLELEDA